MMRTESDRDLNTIEGLRQFITDLTALEEKGFDMSVVKDAAQKAIDLKTNPTAYERRIQQEDKDKLAQLRKDLADEQGKTEEHI